MSEKIRKIRKTSKKNAFHEMSSVADKFFEEMISIFTDCHEYNSHLDEGVKGTTRVIQHLEDWDQATKEEKRNIISSPEFFNSIRVESKLSSSKKNLFNSLTLYMWNSFEKNMFNLIRKSYKEDKEFQSRYVTRFIEFNNQSIEKSKKSKGKASGVIDTKIMLSTKAKRDKIMLDLIKEVVSYGSTLTSYHVLFNDGKWQTEEGKSLYDFFLEIRARRNLLVHRGEEIDKEYIDLCHSGSKSNPILKDVSSINFYYKRGYIQKNRNKENKSIKAKKSPEKLEKGDLANCSFGYFSHVFYVLSNIYFHYWSQVAISFVGKEDNTDLAVFVHDLMDSSNRTRSLIPIHSGVSMTESFFSRCIDLGLNDKISPIDRVNLLLMNKEVSLRGLKENENKKGVLNNLLENESYQVLDRSNSSDAMFKMALAFIRDDFEEGYRLLESISLKEIDEEDMNQWYMFKDLRNKKKFKDAFKKRFGKSYKQL